MPPEPRFVIRFAAEPPQEGLPYGRWAEQLQAEFLAACLRIDSEGEELGEPGEVTWFPDGTYGGRPDLAGDQCTLIEGRFTLRAPDDYRGDTLDVKLFDVRGREIASESLYEDDDEPE